MEWRLKLKYRNTNRKVDPKGGFYFLAPKYLYRNRTGPTCCSANCPSTRKKSKKSVAKHKVGGLLGG